MPAQFITTRQAAKILSLTEKKIRELCLRGLKYGGLEAIKIDAQWRISVDELERFIESKMGKS